MTNVKTLSNGQLYDEWNALVWLLQGGHQLTSMQQSRMDEIQAEASTRPVEK